MSDETLPAIDIRLFGGPRISVESEVVEKFPTQFAAALFTILALAPNRHFERDELARALWPDEDPSATRHRLREYVYTLRKLIPGGQHLIHATRTSVWLSASANVFIDASAYRRLVEEADIATDDMKQLRLLREATDLYTGPIAPGISGSTIQLNRQEFEELNTNCIRSLAVPPEPSDLSLQRTGRQLRRRAAYLWLSATGVLGVALLLLRPGTFTHAQQPPLPPLSPEVRIALIEKMRGDQPDMNQRERANQCLALAEMAWNGWYGRDEQLWLDRLRKVEPDVDQSYNWLLKHDPEGALQLAGAIMRFWYLNNKSNLAGSKLSAALAAAPNRPNRVRARGLVGRSLTLLGGNDTERRRAIVYAEEALSTYGSLGDKWGEGHAQRHLGLLYNSVYGGARAEQAYQAALASFGAAHSDSGTAITLYCYAMIGKPGGTREENQSAKAAHAQCALHIFREIGNEWGIRESFNELAGCAATLDPSSRTGADLRQFQKECREEVRWQESRGNFSEVDWTWRSFLSASLRLDDPPAIVEALGRLAYHSQDLAWRSVLWSAYLSHFKLLKSPPFPAHAIVKTLETDRRTSPTLSIEEAVRRGHTMPLKAVAEFALKSGGS